MRITWLKQFLLWAKTVFNGAAMVFIGVDLDQIDKMAPRRVKSAPGPIELNQHFGAKTDLLDLECSNLVAFLTTWPLFMKLRT